MAARIEGALGMPGTTSTTGTSGTAGAAGGGMSGRAKLILAEIAFAIVVILVILYFFVYAPQQAARVGRVTGAGSSQSLNEGRDSEGYFSEMARFFAGLLFGGKGTRVSDSDLSLMKLQADRAIKAGGTVNKPLPGGPGGSGGKGGGKGGSGKGGGYTRADVVGYSVSSVSKNGDSATVYGTATMKDGNTVSGAVYLRKINGKWEVVGYSM